ncbi:outer membrane protein [Sphingomonas cavernae]|nr:outer membrane beta-barrel protein [Sphingomonas cavernae]
MFRKSLAIAIFAMIPTAAFAQNDELKAFDGLFLGAQAGWGHRTDGSRLYVGTQLVDEFNFSGDSFDYGAFAGYDVRIGNVVLGVEAGIGSGGTAMREDIYGLTVTIKPKWNYEGTARAGYVLGDRTLAYVRGGYGAERLRRSYSDTATGAAVGVAGSEWSNGLVVGGGIEHALAPNVTLRGEYRYKDFDGWYKPQQVLLGATYRF